MRSTSSLTFSRRSLKISSDEHRAADRCWEVSESMTGENAEQAGRHDPANVAIRFAGRLFAVLSRPAGRWTCVGGTGNSRARAPRRRRREGQPDRQDQLRPGQSPRLYGLYPAGQRNGIRTSPNPRTRHAPLRARGGAEVDEHRQPARGHILGERSVGHDRDGHERKLPSSVGGCWPRRTAYPDPPAALVRRRSDGSGGAVQSEEPRHRLSGAAGRGRSPSYS